MVRTGNGNIVLNFLGITAEDLFGEAGFAIANLFGGASLTGFDDLISFTVNSGNESFVIYDNNGWTNGWDFSSVTITYLGNGNGGDDDPSCVPEPATILMLSLSLAGAGLATRRKMRSKK